MKKIIIPVFALAFFTSVINAQEINMTRVGFYGSYGASYPGGTVPTGMDIKVAAGYNVGVNLALPVTDTGALVGSVEYAYKPSKVSYDIAGSTKESTIKSKFYDFLVGWRFVNFEAMYAEIGLFMGTKAGTWKFDSATISDKYINREYGLFAGIGYMAPLSETVDFTIGAQLQGSFKNGYDDKTSIKLKSRLIAARAGLEMKF